MKKLFNKMTSVFKQKKIGGFLLKVVYFLKLDVLLYFLADCIEPDWTREQQENAMQYFFLHKNKVMSNMNLLNDKISKKPYENVLKFRMTGRHFYILKIARPGKEQYVMTSKQRHLLPIKDEFFVDCGAFTGDTLLNYLKRGGGRL